MIQATGALAKKVPVSRACEALGFPRSSLYRAYQPRPETEKQPRPTPPRALSQAEKDTVHAVLNHARFQDHSPRQVYATLLDEGIYHCSISTMYRVLHEHNEIHERRNQLQHPVYAKPELLATDPNQLWSWDGRPFGRLVNISLDMTHHQGWVSSPWRFRAPSSSGLVSFQGTRASCEKEADLQDANVQERMGWD
jgi:hypothetical protein